MIVPSPARTSARNFALALLLLLATVLLTVKPKHYGDVVEYTLQTVALSEHGTPDIRYSDLDKATALAPAFAGQYGRLAQSMRANDNHVYSTFARGTDGGVYAVHFFTYAALAVIPFRLLEAAGMDPFKCFQAVNLATLFILGLCLHRLFGDARKAAFGLALFFACGGILYWNWSSPECFSAAALLSGMILYVTGAPIAACLLAGLAAQQNPTILFFFACAPLLQLAAMSAAQGSLVARLCALFGRRQLAGLALGAVLLAMPPLFNLAKFDVPSIIVKQYSNASYVGAVRLHSFFLDLSQGMAIGLPALLAALLWWGVRDTARLRRSDDPRRLQARRAGIAVLALCAVLTLALVVPALAVTNWNSGAAGMMRYAFWAAMPLVFALLWRLRDATRWPVAGCALLLAAQAGAMSHAQRYPYTDFSPLAKWVMRKAPQLYHPDPEIFAERLRKADGNIDPAVVYTYERNGAPAVTLYDRAQRGIERQLCGAGRELAPDNRVTDSLGTWRYIDGPIRCRDEDPNQLRLRAAQFQQHQATLLASGWSGPEHGGGGWDGVWSDGDTSALRLTVPPTAGRRTLVINGRYFDGNRRTRVKLDGEDLGWLALDRLESIALPDDKAPGATVLVELRHEAPRQAGAQDTRRLAFFMQEISIR